MKVWPDGHLVMYSHVLFQGPAACVSEELLNEVMVIYSMQQGAISIIPINVSGRQLGRSEAEWLPSHLTGGMMNIIARRL